MLPDRESLRGREREVVNEELLKDELCMNRAAGGGYVSGGMSNLKHSADTRQKMSRTATGRSVTPEAKQQISRTLKLKHETAQKERMAQIEHDIKLEVQEKLKDVIAKLEEAKLPWNKGKHLSEQHRQAISDGNKGQTPWIKGLHHTEDVRQRISDNMKVAIAEGRARFPTRLGLATSDETKRKQSEAQKVRWAKRKAAEAKAKEIA